MSKIIALKPGAIPASLLAIAAAMALLACSKQPATTAPTPEETAKAAADSARDAELQAREQEVAQRETDFAAKEQEQAAALQQAQADATAAKKAAAKAYASVPPKTSAATATPVPTTPPKPVVTELTVPTATLLKVALVSDLSSKGAKKGDRFQTRLVSDVMVGDRVAAPAGSRVTGTITDVVSGSNKIGGVPMLGLTLDRLVLPDGQRIPISGELLEQGKSDTARDTAKILGGTAAGAILGHQIKKGSSGKVIGGLLGGAVGAVAAKKTGTEVQIAAGSTLTITTGEPFTVAVH